MHRHMQLMQLTDNTWIYTGLNSIWALNVKMTLNIHTIKMQQQCSLHGSLSFPSLAMMPRYPGTGVHMGAVASDAYHMHVTHACMFYIISLEARQCWALEHLTYCTNEGTLNMLRKPDIHVQVLWLTEGTDFGTYKLFSFQAQAGCDKAGRRKASHSFHERSVLRVLLVILLFVTL